MSAIINISRETKTETERCTRSTFCSKPHTLSNSPRYLSTPIIISFQFLFHQIISHSIVSYHISLSHPTSHSSPGEAIVPLPLSSSALVVSAIVHLHMLLSPVTVAGHVAAPQANLIFPYETTETAPARSRAELESDSSPRLCSLAETRLAGRLFYWLLVHCKTHTAEEKPCPRWFPCWLMPTP